MDIVKTDNLPQGQMPTIFEDRTLFPTPPVIDAKFSQQRSNSWVLPIVIFLFMLIPLGILGWMAMEGQRESRELAARLNDMVKAQVDAQTASLNGDIQKLEGERDALAAQLATLSQNKDLFDRNLGRLITESASLVKEIDELLAVAPRLRGPRPDATLRTIPTDWDAPSTAVLQRHVDLLKAHRIKVINYRDPAPSSEGTITVQ